MDIRKLNRVVNLLPPPSELAKPKVMAKVTLPLSLDTFEFFKKQARKHNTKHQHMIRQVLNRYKAHYRAI